MLHASNLSRNLAKSRGSFYFSCNSQRNNCSCKMGCYSKQRYCTEFEKLVWISAPPLGWGGEQGGKSPFSLLSEPISPSSLLFLANFSLLPKRLRFFFSLLPTFSPYFSLLLTFFGPFLPPPYSVPPPSLKLTDMVSFKSSCLLGWNGMFTKVASMDKIELICMAVVFVFCRVS